MVGVGGGRWVSSSSANIINRFSSSDHHKLISASTASANSARRNEFPTKKKSKPRLISISTAEAKWHGKWNSEYLFSLRDLQLLDLDDVHKDTNVSIALSVQKHAGFGLSVEGRISTSFTRKCCNCCSPYLRDISSTFKVWILPSTRTIRDSSNQLPDIGGDDPSVIYVKPGYEADLDSLIQDTVRLATSVKETCSDTCEKAEPKLHHLGARNAPSIDRRWHKLLELKKRHELT
ncbi:large ribosomal RNA subunit accumulation protein YCED homolog 2, chloroplastic isoform X2 [Salvia miltiorrhiza]|uniref:large ribosomal RNA subunit accumulation protein YCED homolog 2, chloroplastic isoform X2 n=1 Tax=Salvia miltiorrhiza TaxID=226208 RepID=UPI0025ACBAAF|nr:large ribosomal RNA subunit accumulation protein YCED homolog 2, chloroplastic isoform X2 [Salvia miltiorrhiza]